MKLTELETVLAVSPHLDDAVFACGDLFARLPRVVVVTVFAGTPQAPGQLTEWDSLSGFANAGEAMQGRRAEDGLALQALAATPLWLEFVDSQYGVTTSAAELADAMRSVITDVRPSAVLIPAGLFHTDHIIVHDAMQLLRLRHRDLQWLMYEESLYRHFPGLLQARLAALHDASVEATPAGFLEQASTGLKRDAVSCYASQLRALDSKRDDVLASILSQERYWQLEGVSAVHPNRL